MDRYRNLIGVLSVQPQEDKEIYFGMLQDVFDNASKYTAVVSSMESRRLLGGYYKDSKEHREEVSDFDKRRSVIHNALISSVNAMNRVCEKLGVAEPFYNGGPHRREYGDFAMELVAEIFSERV